MHARKALFPLSLVDFAQSVAAMLIVCTGSRCGAGRCLDRIAHT